ncbi:MAG: thrombospondin type 3 repeat-containing protein [Saprospiraceae bacterium]|nr:thrombospondin type 3 repeat-containing protein [Saprospiraceae bacterium]MDW8229155.1 thrombospondin type 3 repeat-containing protein [Saprospiraceae bacterium]
MNKFSFLVLFLLCVLLHTATTTTAQNRDYPNAVYAKLNFIDFGLANGTDLNLGEGFEVGYLRNIAPFLNIGVPLKMGLARLPQQGETPASQERSIISSLDVIAQLGKISSDARVSPYLFAGGGFFMEEFKNGHLQIPFGLGANFRLSKYAFINAQAEYRKAIADKRDNAQIGLGFVYLLHESPNKPQPDRDGDGVPDVADQCPDQPGPAPARGCPDYDRDGVPDKEDDCPTMAGRATAKGCPDQDGDGFADKEDDCPTTAGSLRGCPDRDNDGVPDKDDLCPDQAGTARGCPDRDGDGVPDKDDLCPNEPGSAATNGCPPVRDSDGDGITDDKDPCPNAAGPFNGCPDTDGDSVPDNLDKCPNTTGLSTNFGCPEVKKEDKKRLAFATKNIQFHTGKTELTSSSFKILDGIVKIMQRYPDYKLLIQGHTDNVGDPERNLVLSQGRAQTCFDYLVYKGIKAERLKAEGFGDTRPIADNRRSAGRALNRRVEFKLVLDFDEKK